ncbi:DUF6912 family protein [Sphaerimonospora thailandensis]|uniref:Uncharacterized protein n=1 Tax=Sphaerimonospora thailandensis TaxID=795644 RepID=A0A8J3R6P3_9ACTN|nr:hypothetical protein [Sphaerimonospora thailandensis]GIH68820.1 hypothetical protein Mth01_10730 [Sphaerimonospora thailandensis]
MRVYLPCTLSALAELVAAGELGPAPLTGYAVTPALVEWYVSGDTEELEYVALTEAARASLRMLAAERAEEIKDIEDVKAAGRRVVIAAEVPDDMVKVGTDLEDRGRVRLLEPVPLAKFASVHVDDLDAVPDVAAAMAALPAADAGDDDARFVVDGAEDHELMWYATQEIPYLLT